MMSPQDRNSLNILIGTFIILVLFGIWMAGVQLGWWPLYLRSAGG